MTMGRRVRGAERRRCFLAFLIGLALLVLSATSTAQPAGPEPSSPPAAAPAAPPEPAPEVDAKRAEAFAHFEKGIVLFEEEAWSAALAEFLRSRELYPTRANTKNAAICLRKLQRYDEALDLYEALLSGFSSLPEDDRALAERAVTELRGLVGAVELRGAEAGASIVIDGRDRGKTPTAGPLRVAAGTHVVRLYKDGFAPFEARVDVPGGRTIVVEARLGALTRSGRLKVTEETGKALEVVVDNVVVGTTPWEGALAVGEHTVVLRGPDRLGTQPAAAPVSLNRTTALTLVAETLDAELRVEPTPRGAAVAVDGVAVGRGIWNGRLRAGGHRVEIAAEGFLAVARDVSLQAGEREVVTVSLARDPDSPLWQAKNPPKITFDLTGGLAITPSLGGDVAGDCDDPCETGPGLGAAVMLHGGYQFGSGIGLALGAGYLSLAQSTTGRSTRLLPRGLEPNPGVADDSLALRGLLVGGAASLHLGEAFPLLIRLGAGGLFGSLTDRRTGSFTTVEREVSDGAGGTTILPATPYETGELEESPSATYLFVAPEARAGVRLGDHVEIGASLGAYVLFGVSRPTWADERFVTTGNDGAAVFGEQDLAGGTILVLVPGLGARLDF